MSESAAQTGHPMHPTYPLPFAYDDVAALLDRTADAGQPAAAPRFDDVLADLADLRLAPGTPVVIAMANGRRLLEQYFAALLTGAVPLLVSPATPSARIKRLARETGAGAVVAARLDPGRYDAASAIPVGDAACVRLPYAAAGIRHPPGTVLMLTSGTSGVASACLHRVDSLARNARRHAAAVGLRADDTVLVTLPLFFSYSVVAQAFAALATGARLVVSGPPFVPAAYLDSLRRHSVTSSSVTPTIARALLSGDHRLPAGLRMLTVGGDRLDPRHVSGLLASNPGVELAVTYGLTEAGPRVSTLAAHREPVSRYGSVGLPMEGVSVSLRPAPNPGHAPNPGPAQELVVASDTVLIGKAGSGPRDRGLIGPGVVATGDLFRIDDDGYLFFEGRISDFVVLRGEKVSLFAVRQFVQSLPDVVGCRTEVSLDGAGTGFYDLRVHLTATAAGDPAAAEKAIRRETNTFLLPAERPRSVTVEIVESAAFRK
jgi:long-chain acyl-CoA synthetase